MGTIILYNRNATKFEFEDKEDQAGPHHTQKYVRRSEELTQEVSCLLAKQEDLIEVSVPAPMSVKVSHGGWRNVSAFQECLLFLQRTRVWYPAPTSGSPSLLLQVF